MKMPASIIFIALFIQVQSIAPEFGEFSELKGLRKVYIQSADLEARKMVVKEIEGQVRAKKVDLEMVSVPEEADIFILFGSQVVGDSLHSIEHGELAVSIKGKGLVGGQIIVPEGAKPYRHRIVFSAKNKRHSFWQGNPVKESLKKFLKDFGKLQREGGPSKT